MITKVLIAAGLAALPLSKASADQMVGAWFTHIEKDPFSPKRKSVIATGSTSGGAILAIRCFPEGGLSVVINTGAAKHFERDAAVSYKYRADQGDIVEEKGSAFGEGMVDLPNARAIMADAEKASTLYFRISQADGAVVDLQFRTRGAAKALSAVKADCAADAPEEKKDAPDKK